MESEEQERSGQLVRAIEDSEEERFRVLIETKSKHADLWPLVKKLGSQKALADQIGACNSLLGKWVNLQSFPNMGIDSHRKAVEKLHLITGSSYEELWPRALEKAIRSGKAAVKRDFMIESAMLGLAENAGERLFLPDPSEVLAERELKELIGGQSSPILKILPPREAEVIRMRFGMGGYDTHTLEEVAKKWGITRERIRELEARAIRKLRDAAKRLPVLREVVEGKL